MQVGLSEAQYAIKFLSLALSGVVIFIVLHTVFDLLRYLAYRFKFRQSFLPRSWLFVAVASLWTMLTPTRGQAIGHVPSINSIEFGASTKSSQHLPISSLLTCSVVVTGLLLEIGKIRGRQLCKLEAHSRLNHPSAAATIIEQSLRAVQNSQSSQGVESVEVRLPANSDDPVFVPLGVCDSRQVLVDLGRHSAVNILSNDQIEQVAVFNALIVSSLFAAINKPQTILYSSKAKTSTKFVGLESLSSFAEVLDFINSTGTNCIVFSREVLNDLEIVQLRDNGAAVVCLHSTANPTTELRANNSAWRLSPSGDSIIPFGLSGTQISSLSELLNDVDRCADEASASPTTSTIAFENINHYKVLVRTLGPVDVQLADGTVIKFEKSKTKELLAWLTSHRSRPTRSAARTALWEFTVADATFTNVVSDIRRTLNHTDLLSPLEEWVPRTFSDQLLFHDSIISDGELLQACIIRAKSLPAETAIIELQRGLELVRDLPFAGTGYLWPDAEGITSQLVMTVITAASMAAEIALQLGDFESVFWATAQGLKVLGGHEELFALRMRAHSLRGDLAGVRFEFDSYQRAIGSDSFSPAEPSPKLVCLLRDLTNSSPAVGPTSKSSVAPSANPAVAPADNSAVAPSRLARLSR